MCHEENDQPLQLPTLVLADRWMIATFGAVLSNTDKALVSKFNVWYRANSASGILGLICKNMRKTSKVFDGSQHWSTRRCVRH